jgi:hypothetical protein
MRRFPPVERAGGGEVTALGGLGACVVKFVVFVAPAAIGAAVPAGEVEPSDPLMLLSGMSAS